VYFFAGGGAIWGGHIMPVILAFSVPNQEVASLPTTPIDRQTMSLGHFMSQKVLNMGGAWCSRENIIACLASNGGVHPGSKPNPKHVTANLADKLVQYQFDENMGLNVVFEPTEHNLREAELDPNIMSPLLMEQLATINFTLRSPDIHRLEATIRAEFGLCTRSG
jgi:hypothetical protein